MNRRGLGWQNVMTVLLAMGFLISCSGSKESASTTASPSAGKASDPSDPARQKALQSYIDGSLFEMKGDYAQAILEYQDALRYDRNPAVYYTLSKCYSRLSKHNLAIEAGKEAVRLSPETVDYWRNVGDVYTSAYQLDSAAVAYEEVVRRDSNNIESWFALANLYQGRKPQKAVEVYEKMNVRFGDDWDVLYQMAELYGSIGETEKAIGTLERMLVVDPGNTELKRSLAQAYVRVKRYDDALRLYGELREVDKENLDYLGETATVYLLLKNYTKAAELFNVVLERDSVSLEAKLRIGEAYFSQLQNDSTLVPVATSMFERIRDGHPDDWRPYWFLGAIGSVSRNDTLAENNFKRVTELAPWNADGWSYLAMNYLQKEQFQEVATSLEEALKVLPDDFQVNLFLGIAYTRLQRTDEALHVLEHAHKINPKDIRAISQLALVYDGQKRYTDSDSLYEEGLSVDPQNHLILNNYAYSLCDRGLQLERALKMAQTAVAAQPDNASYLDTIGWVYFRLEQYEAAEKFIKMAIEKGEASAVVHEHLGDVYYMTNDKDRAMEQWNAALKLDENNQALRDKISRGRI